MNQLQAGEALAPFLQTPRDTDRRDCRQTCERQQLSLNYCPNYDLSRYNTLNVSDPGPSTSQSSILQTMPRNESSQSTGKRKKTMYSPEQKLVAIDMVRDRRSKADTSRMLGISESTLRGWCKAEDKIRAQLNNARTAGTYDHTSQSTPTQNTMGMSTCGVAERVNEESEAGPAPKRPKIDNNLTFVAAAATINMNNMSTVARMGSTMMMSMTNKLLTSNVHINGVRMKYAHELTFTAKIQPRVTASRQNNQSPNAEKLSGSISQPTNNRTFPMPSTSANSGSVANNSKSSEDCKKLDDILRQPGAGQSECSIAEILANNAMNNNNSNVDHVDNKTSENSLPPEFAVMLEYGTKFADWLEKYGSAVCTFHQVFQINGILRSMSNWAESKENSNGTS
ncbi:uncharacterized protein [Temnothorax longispinosus]